MKERRKCELGSWSRFFWCTYFVVFSCVVVTGVTFSTFTIFGERFRPVLVSSWRKQAMEALSGDSFVPPAISIRETVIFPDQELVFLKYRPSARLFTKDDMDCLYFSPNSSDTHIKPPPEEVDGETHDPQIVRCPPRPRGFTLSLGLRSNFLLRPGPTHQWNSLVYEALIDRDNTTVAFVKGLNLRPDRPSDPKKFECVYGWDFRKPKFLLRSDVVSIAQEVIRCRTPLSILNNPHRRNSTIKVSVRMKGKGKGILHSVAEPKRRSPPDLPILKQHDMCICTMVRNQARFLREWIMYHARIGVQRWFIYDNNSVDNMEKVLESLQAADFNISRHLWPWIKTQEAGFAHCALRARDSCEWVGFIDVDEFLHLPSGMSLQDVLANYSSSGKKNVAELRVSCYSFGPSGLTSVSPKGLAVGYTCRLAAPERHKSIVRPEALNSTLINVVHHFHLRSGFNFANADKGAMVINHYKYQVWDVFKDKFYRRVAAYVADWQNEENAGSKDRAPGLGTRAVEPPDWPTRFCEVTDTGLRDRVLRIFQDPETKMMPWQERQQEDGDGSILTEQERSQRLYSVGGVF